LASASAGGAAHQHVLFPIIEPGTFFGERCLSGDNGEANLVDYVASSKTDLFSIAAEGLIEAMHKHLSKEICKSIAEKLVTDMKHKAHLRLWGMRMAYAKLLEECNQLLITQGQTQKEERKVLESFNKTDDFYIDFKKKRDVTHVLFLQIWWLLHRKFKTDKTTIVEEVPRLVEGIAEAESPLQTSPPLPPPGSDSSAAVAQSVVELHKKMSEMNTDLNQKMATMQSQMKTMMDLLQTKVEAGPSSKRR